MYGAFWCSHCHEQKEAFGSQAMKDFPYVECYPDGFHKVSNLYSEESTDIACQDLTACKERAKLDLHTDTCCNMFVLQVVMYKNEL